MINSRFHVAVLALILLAITVTGCDQKEEPTATPPGVTTPPATREAPTQPSTKP